MPVVKTLLGHVTRSATGKPWTAYHYDNENKIKQNMGQFDTLTGGKKIIEAAYNGNALFWERNDVGGIIENWDAIRTQTIG